METSGGFGWRFPSTWAGNPSISHASDATPSGDYWPIPPPSCGAPQRRPLDRCESAVNTGIRGQLCQVRFGHLKVVCTVFRATKYLCPLRVIASMFALLQLGGFGTLESLLVGLVLLAVVLLVGRLVMKVAWRLVIIAIIAVAVLWLLSLLGLGVV